MKKKILYFLKLCISLVIIYFIIRKIDISKLNNFVLHIPLFSILTILILSFLKHCTQYFNWKRLLHLNRDYKPEKSELLKSYIIGLSLRFLAPGGLAMFGKMYFVRNSKKATFFSVGLEKFMMSWANVFAASCAVIFYFETVNLVFKIIIAILVGLAPFYLFLIKFFLKKKSHLDFFEEYTKNILQLILNQLIYVFLTFCQFYLILRVFSDINFINTMIGVSVIIFSHVIPITISGLGLREAMSMKIFDKFGVASELAVAASLLVFLANSALPGLIGIYFLLKEKRKS